MKQRIEITAMLPGGSIGPYPIDADVVGGLAIHKAVRGIQLDDAAHTLTHVGTGLALCDGKPPMLRRVRTALLALDVPWEEAVTSNALWPYRLAIMDAVKAAKGAAGG